MFTFFVYFSQFFFRFWPNMNRENDDDAYFYGPILFLKRGDFGGTLRSWREIAIICISENWTHSLSPFEFIVLRKKVKNDLTKVWKWGTFFYYYLLSISLNIFQICELFLTHLSLWSGKPRFNVHSNDRCAE